MIRVRRPKFDTSTHHFFSCLVDLQKNEWILIFIFHIYHHKINLWYFLPNYRCKENTCIWKISAFWLLKFTTMDQVKDELDKVDEYVISTELVQYTPIRRYDHRRTFEIVGVWTFWKKKLQTIFWKSGFLLIFVELESRKHLNLYYTSNLNITWGKF